MWYKNTAVVELISFFITAFSGSGIACDNEIIVLLCTVGDLKQFNLVKKKGVLFLLFISLLSLIISGGEFSTLLILVLIFTLSVEFFCEQEKGALVQDEFNEYGLRYAEELTGFIFIPHCLD
ncbi:hypothetical protein Pcaca05_28290 [Pectobacterium carotovorum subsp. carotovorum]|nr:hypothetical protein Pcaca05_28290 [Pectobacterium carotovorum subsp. carotovorum]